MILKSYLVRHHLSYFKAVIVMELTNWHVFNYLTNAFLILNVEQLIHQSYYSSNVLMQYPKALVYP